MGNIAALQILAHRSGLARHLSGVAWKKLGWIAAVATAGLDCSDCPGHAAQVLGRAADPLVRDRQEAPSIGREVAAQEPA
jgi:hypothetical protein